MKRHRGRVIGMAAGAAISAALAGLAGGCASDTAAAQPDAAPVAIAEGQPQGHAITGVTASEPAAPAQPAQPAAQPAVTETAPATPTPAAQPKPEAPKPEAPKPEAPKPATPVAETPKPAPTPAPAPATTATAPAVAPPARVYVAADADQAARLRNWQPVTAYYPNGNIVAGPTYRILPGDPATTAPEDQLANNAFTDLLFPPQAILFLPWTLVTPVWTDVTYHGVEFPRSYTLDTPIPEQQLPPAEGTIDLSK